jgi:hypothetical protein
MATTLLFVHGTGVRADGYQRTLRAIQRQVDLRGWPVEVPGCFWGEAEGAQLRAEGASIPGFKETGGEEPSETDQVLALWTILYTDPWYELRLLRHRPPPPAPPFGQPPPPVLLLHTVEEFTPSADLRAAFTDAGLGAYLDDALASVRAAPELREAAQTAPADPLEHRRAIARAIVAAALLAAEDAGEPAASGETRDQLVLTLTSELHGEGLGVPEFLLRPVKGLALRLVTRKLTGERGSISDAAAPTAGDVLRFLANGDGARAFIRRAILDPGPGPTYVLAHSLGGIMCADLLIREPVPGVAGLITIGSQTPFLYEIGALPALNYPEPLPQHMPRWLNIYDRRDLLSYIGAGLFGVAVNDVEVHNGQPFPQSHSAYWTNPAVWNAIGGFMA